MSFSFDCSVLSGRGLCNKFRGVLPSVVYVRRGLHEATLHATRQRVQSPASERAASKMGTHITCRNEKAVRSASSALVHHSTSQR
jgi:hypothetical protein